MLSLVTSLTKGAIYHNIGLPSVVGVAVTVVIIAYGYQAVGAAQPHHVIRRVVGLKRGNDDPVRVVYCRRSETIHIG